MAQATNLERARGGGSDANSLILTATSSFSSTLSSSDLDTESTRSFFPERSITLGSLIGIAGGVSATADDCHPSIPRSSGANHVNCRAGTTRQTSVGSTTSSQGISFSHVSRIHDGAKLWSLLPCGTCIYVNHKVVCKGFCCANQDSSCIVSSATEPLSSSLGHFLTAERDADRDMERSSNEAQVYINIMYEESQRVEEAAVNPLFDLDSTSAIVGMSGSTFSRDSRETRSPPRIYAQSQSTSGEEGVMPSLPANDGTFMMQSSTVGGITSMPCGTPSLPVKGQKAPSNNVREVGCVPYMWTRCRF